VNYQSGKKKRGEAGATEGLARRGASRGDTGRALAATSGRPIMPGHARWKYVKRRDAILL